MAASEAGAEAFVAATRICCFGLSDLGHAELEVLGRTDRYHQYRRPPTGRPIDPRIHKTAPITNRMIPIVVRIPMSVSHPSRSRTNPRMSTRLPPQSTSRAMRRGTRPTGLCLFGHRGVNPRSPSLGPPEGPVAVSRMRRRGRVRGCCPRPCRRSPGDGGVSVASRTSLVAAGSRRPAGQPGCCPGKPSQYSQQGERLEGP
jgi:hypothetical protein